MSIALALPTSQRPALLGDDALEPSRMASPRSLAAVGASSAQGSSGPSALLPWLARSVGESSASWLVSPTSARPGSGAGYAAATAASAATGKSASAGPKAPAGSRITGEWSFLTDGSLSVEEKLARFMAAVQKKLDDELVQKMDEYKAKYGEGGTEAKKDDGGIFGAITKIVGAPLAVVDSLVGGADGFLKDALKSLGGPLLAALATAVGLPMLAPAALALGKSLGAMVAGDSSTKKTPAKKTDGKTDTKGTATKPKADAKTAKGEAGSPDERLQMLEIQRLVDKQNQMFTLVSNVMKSMHDTSMVAVQNVR
jgi:hypothetical protein